MAKKTKKRTSWYAREWIAHKGLRQKDIVDRTPFNKGQVSEYLSGERRWNEDVLGAFAEALGVEPADLLRPPGSHKNELADYVMAMDEKSRKKALRVLKAALEDEGAGGATSKEEAA